MFTLCSISTVYSKVVFESICEFEHGDSNRNNHNCNRNNLHDDNNWNETRISRPLTRREICSLFVGIRDWRIIWSPIVLCTTSTWPTWTYFWNNNVVGASSSWHSVPWQSVPWHSVPWHSVDYKYDFNGQKGYEYVICDLPCDPPKPSCLRN